MIDRLIDFVRVCVRTYVYLRVHAFVYARACARVRMRSQKEKVPGITTKISAALVVVGRIDGRNVSEGPEKKQCPSQIYLIVIVM